MPHEENGFRPGAIVLTLALMGISTLFAGLGVAYLYTLLSIHSEAPLPPVWFLINIPVLFVATKMLKRCIPMLDALHVQALRRGLVVCVFLTLIFITLQIFGWINFFEDIPISASQARSFLFVLSALHLLHVVAGMPFLLRFIWMNASDVNLLRFTARYRRNFLRGLVRYWNYLDILWMLLVLILCIGYVLKWL